MNQEFHLEGVVAAIEKRGQSRGFWTAKIKENPDQQYGRPVSFNQFKKDSDEPTGNYEFLQEAFQSQQPVRAYYYETPNAQNPDAPFKNGIRFEYASNGSPPQSQPATGGGGGSQDNWSPPDYGGQPRSKAEDKDALITATAITKSLIEGRYLTQENLENGVFKQLVTNLVNLVHEVSA